MLGTGHRRPSLSVEQLDVITVVGDLDRAGLDRLRALCQCVPATGARTSGSRTLSIDFRGMTGCPSALFPLLADANAMLRAADMELNLIGLTEALVEIMRPTRRAE